MPPALPPRETYEVIHYPIADIKVPLDRQRNLAVADDNLIASIESIGLLNPIILHSDGTLVCGERRLDAFRKMKQETIPAAIFEHLNPMQRFEAELQENLARKQLTWEEEVRAIGHYHAARVHHFAGWTQLATGSALGFSQNHISRILVIYEHIDREDVQSCPTMQGAFNLLVAQAQHATIAAQSRGLIAADTVSTLLPAHMDAHATKEERTAALLSTLKTASFAAEAVDDLDKTLKLINEGKAATAALTAAKKLEIVNELVVCADFLEWAETYTGPKFDVLHIDFPYGKGYSGARTRRTGKSHIAPIYADDPDIYLGLVEGFLALQDKLAFSTAHCAFWFDMQYYHWTLEQFTNAGWTLIQPYPYIWSKGYQGIASDVKRRPRHVYETALLFSRGDRKLVKLDKDHFDCAIDEKLHLNQKPIAMLKHLLSMFVNEHTAVLDPTCGSGSALAAAKLIGAQRVLGVELDPNNADVAKFMLQRALIQQPTDEATE